MTEMVSDEKDISSGAEPSPREAELIGFIERAAVEHAMFVCAAKELVDADQALEHCVTVADIGEGNARKQAALATVRELLEHVGELSTDQLVHQQAGRPGPDAHSPSGVARTVGRSSVEDGACALHPDCEFGGCMLQNAGAGQNIRMLPAAFARLGSTVPRAGGDLGRAHAVVQDARTLPAFAALGNNNDSGRSALLGQQQSDLTATANVARGYENKRDGGERPTICQNAECGRELPPKARLCFEFGSNRLFCSQVCLTQQQERERGRVCGG